MEYSIVDAAPEHIPQIHGIELECFSMPWSEAILSSQMRDSRHEFIAAVMPSGDVLGYVGMMYVLDEGYISNVAVKSEYRRSGIGDALITELLRRAGEHKLSFVALEVRASNQSAVNLYAKHGFLTVGTRKNYYERPREDALLMTVFLKSD